MRGRSAWLYVVLATTRLEIRQLLRDKAYVLLTVLAAVSFLGLVSLFGLTASDAPMALVVHDRGPYARKFVEALVKVPHAFRLTRMTPADADARLAEGRLVGSIVIPQDFSSEIASGATVAVEVEIDNVNVDIVTDVQRALPAAIVVFGHDVGLPGLRVRLVEQDIWPRDTSFLPYITVSGLALAALIVASVLGALAVARELEARTLRVWRLSPASVSSVLAGKVTAAALLGASAIAVATLAVVFGYGAVPVHPVAAIAGLFAAVTSFACMGAWIGTLARRTLVVVPLLFGLAMPLYIDSGALEPTRFDGELIWYLAHLTPLYYVVGWLEWAFFGLRITPEAPWVNLFVTVVLGVLAFVVATRRLSAHAAILRGRG